MKRIFWGLLLIFFDFNLNFMEVYTLSVLPDFIGYALICSGMGRVEGGAPFGSGRGTALAAAVVTGLIWIANILGVGQIDLVFLAFSLVTALLQVLVTWMIVKGVRFLEEEHRWDLLSRQLKTAWTVVVIWVALGQVLVIAGLGVLSPVAYILAIIFMIYYLVRFHKSRKAYEERLDWGEE